MSTSMLVGQQGSLLQTIPGSVEKSPGSWDVRATVFCTILHNIIVVLVHHELPTKTPGSFELHSKIIHRYHMYGRL